MENQNELLNKVLLNQLDIQRDEITQLTADIHNQKQQIQHLKRFKNIQILIDSFAVLGFISTVFFIVCIIYKSIL